MLQDIQLPIRQINNSQKQRLITTQKKHFMQYFIQQGIRQLKWENILLAVLHAKKINEFDRGSINIQVGVNVMAEQCEHLPFSIMCKKANK